MRDYISSGSQDFSGRAKELVITIKAADPDLAAEILALELRMANVNGQQAGIQEGRKITDRVLERFATPSVQPQAGEG